MTTQEFSNEFDVLYNNIMSNQAPGLDEYEKSVFLTKAQLEILKNYFNPKGNKYGQGFDENAKRQIDFSTLITVAKPSPYTPTDDYVKFDDRSQLYRMPSDILLVLNETGINTVGEVKRLISIVPINYEEYARLMSKPWKQPLKNQGWRLFQSTGGVDYISEVVIKYNSTLTDYKIRYVRRPKPIILANLADEYSNISIGGLNNITECELDPILHPEILQRAVELAKSAYTGDLKSSVELGQRTE
jgi:hypothetical protein|nr:MAG TPA: hypothetical protein [Crassvirales sp.]